MATLKMDARLNVTHLSSHLFFGAKTTSVIVQIYYVFSLILFTLFYLVFKIKKYNLFLSVDFSQNKIRKDVANYRSSRLILPHAFALSLSMMN
jgi:hypothetical protein